MSKKVQTLVVTMNQSDYTLLEKMNIQTDAIIGNQCSFDRIDKFDYKGHLIKWLSFDERGVGLNRNNVFMRADKEFCVFADDDMVFIDGYEKIVLDSFKECKNADVIIFNIEELAPSKRRKTQKIKKVNLFNYMNYGAARLAVRRKAISYNGIYFNLNFGGGTEHSCGEDTLFIRSCLKAGLRVYTVPYSIASLVNERPSSWFEGYTKKYFYDKGVVLGLAHPILARIFSMYMVLKHPEYIHKSNLSIIQILRTIFEGIKEHL